MKVRKLEKEYYGFEYYLTNLYIAMAFKSKKLTTREAEVLAAYMEAFEVFGNEFNSKSRMFVKEKLGISKQGLTNYERYLKGKKYIIKDSEGKWIIDPFVVPDKRGQGYLLKLSRK